jgi:flagellar biosynthetic protein FliP
VKRALVVIGVLVALLACAAPAHAQAVPTWSGIDRSNDPSKVVTTLEIMLLLTVLALAPSILVLMTAFTRIVIVLSFVRRGLGTNELPPNQIIVGLSLILTFMVMAPTFREIRQHAVTPYLDNRITQKEAYREAMEPMRRFMFAQTRRKDIKLFIDITKTPVPARVQNKDIPTEVLVPAFVISELRRAFVMGFAIFLPFLVIDLIVSTTLISMGMLVLPPVLVSLPFKILLFVLVDGWHLVVGSLVKSFY